MGYWGSDPQWGYHRFALANAIPATATLVDVVLELQGFITYEWDSTAQALEVFAELSADAQGITSGTDAPYVPGGRPVTTASVRWPGSGGLSWTLGSYNSSPNLAAVLQEVVNAQGGLAQGSHVQLWIRGAQTAQGECACYAYGTSGYKPARLTIVWYD